MIAESENIKQNEHLSFVSLLSTGLDSPIATYLLMNKGFDCISISFLHNYPKSKLNKDKAIKIGQRLVELTNQNLTMYFVNYDVILQKLKSTCEDRIRCILCKRTMLDISQFIALEENAKFIVTGEILGEQASQTIDNLFVIDKIIRDIPIIRPLIGFNKLDIIKLSQKLDFYDISLLEENGCNYNPKYPETRANLKKIINEEKKLDRVGIRNFILENSERFVIK